MIYSKYFTDPRRAVEFYDQVFAEGHQPELQQGGLIDKPGSYGQWIVGVNQGWGYDEIARGRREAANVEGKE